MTLTPYEEAAVEAACRAVEAYQGRGVGHRPYAAYSAADALEERLGPFDWSDFNSGGYRLLREVYRRGAAPGAAAGGTPDRPRTAGARYEDRYSPARERISRALPA